jgi:hypothetical protein
MSSWQTLPAGSRLLWLGDNLEAAVRAEYVKRLWECGTVIQNDLKRKLSTPTRSAGPSKPGEYPHADTGALRNSIFTDVDPQTMTCTVGSPLKLSLWLEFGVEGGKVIQPTEGAVLSWVDGDGVRHFARWVRQGRIEPRALFRSVLMEDLPKCQRIFTRRLDFRGSLGVGLPGAA